MISLDEKIEIFERFNKTKEELNSKTIFEGYPIGQWSILIRNRVRAGIKITEEQLEKLDKLGILERQIETTIDEKIEKVIQWSRKYPEAKVFHTYIPVKILREYSNSEEQYKNLVNEFKKIQRYYRYIRERKSDGKLTKEQELKCKAGNVRGVFGTPTYIIELSEKYRISVDKIKYIMENYETVENFIEAYKKGMLTKKDKKLFADNLRKCIDIGMKENMNYDLLAQAVFKNDDEYITEESMNIYYSQEIEKALEELTEEELNVIKTRFGIEDGIYRTTQEAGEILSETRHTIKRIENRAIKKIRNQQNLSNSESLAKILEQELNSEKEKNLKEHIKNTILNSNIIFYPDKEFENEPNDIDIKELYNSIEKLKTMIKERKQREEYCKEINKILENREKWKYNQQAEPKNNTDLKDDIDISVLNLSVRPYNALKRAGINTMGQLNELTKTGIENISYLGRKSRKELYTKLKEYGIYEDNTQETEIEHEKNEREKLEKYTKELQEKLKQAQVVLDNYEELLEIYKNTERE